MIDVSTLVDVVAIGVAVAAIVFGIWQNSNILKARVFLDLRENYLHTIRGIPPEHRDPHWTPSTPAEIRALEAYWYNALNEWFVTTRLYSGALRRKLWDGFYRDAILRGLTHRSFRIFFCALERSEPFTGVEQEFFGTIRKLYADRNNGTPIDQGFTEAEIAMLLKQIRPEVPHS